MVYRDLTRAEVAALPREGWSGVTQGQFENGTGPAYRGGRIEGITSETAEAIVQYVLALYDGGAMESMKVKVTPYATSLHFHYGFGHIYVDYRTAEQSEACRLYHEAKKKSEL
jgi:hypothetical protein